MILILMVEGAKAVISFCIRSAIPGYMVVPPDMTVLAYRSFLMSTSHFMIELKVVSWTPQDSIPRKEGWKSASGARNLSLPMVITWPSGNSYDFSREVDAAAVAIKSKDVIGLFVAVKEEEKKEEAPPPVEEAAPAEED